MIEAIDRLKDIHLLGFNFCFQCQSSSQYYNLSITDKKNKKVLVKSSADIEEINQALKVLIELYDDDEEDLL